MKTFLNVLYRRVLYKIPFKWLLVLLVIICLGIASFASAETVEDLINLETDTVITTSNSAITNVYHLNSSDLKKIFCITINDIGTKTYNNNPTVLKIGQTDGSFFDDFFKYVSMFSNWQYPITNCFYMDKPYLSVELNPYSSSTKIASSLDYEVYSLTNLLNAPLPVMTSLECQTNYSLIPVSSVNSTYCKNNFGLIDPSECTGGGGGGSLTDLYINNILHLGAPTIVMNIAEEIDWDYAYTSSGAVMNIDVVGYNVDYEKIGEIVDNQNYKPSGEDFQQIVGILGPYTKIIVFFVFLFIVWAWIKKPFKSKKL